jgi:hypothetical protein
MPAWPEGLVVDGDSRSVFYSALDIVDADVVTEDGPGVLIREFDGGAGETDEGGVRKGIAHVAGKTVDEVILAAVGLIGDDHDVLAVRENRVTVALLLREELLDGREDHPAEATESFWRRSARSAACMGA